MFSNRSAAAGYHPGPVAPSASDGALISAIS